jgi:nucleoside permease NupC
MFVMRFVVVVAALFLLGMGVAYVVTRDRRYLRIAWRTMQFVLVLAVALALFYVFERVLLL